MKSFSAILSMLLIVFAVLGAQAKPLDEKNRRILENFMKQENIVKVTEIKDSDWGRFIQAYLKIPLSVRNYMREGQARIHIMQGEGVTVDPTWAPFYKQTPDHRAWDQVPGAGGYPYAGVPTRIVVNKMAQEEMSHGSVNLLVHEYAHAFDSNESLNRFSNSPYWKNVFKAPSSQAFLRKICNQYCAENPSEAFAEVFVYYLDKDLREVLKTEANSLHGYMVELIESYVIHRHEQM